MRTADGGKRTILVVIRRVHIYGVPSESRSHASTETTATQLCCRHLVISAGGQDLPRPWTHGNAVSLAGVRDELVSLEALERSNGAGIQHGATQRIYAGSPWPRSPTDFRPLHSTATMNSHIQSSSHTKRARPALFPMHQASAHLKNDGSVQPRSPDFGYTASQPIRFGHKTRKGLNYRGYFRIIPPHMASSFPRARARCPLRAALAGVWCEPSKERRKLSGARN